MPPNAAMLLAKEMPEGALRRSHLSLMAYHAAQKHGAQYTDFSGEVFFYLCNPVWFECKIVRHKEFLL